MVADWRYCSVRDIKASSPHALVTGPFGSSISSRFFQDSGIPIIRGSNLSENIDFRLIDDGQVFLSNEKAHEFERSIARAGDLIFTCWGTIGQVGLIDKRCKYPAYVISNKQMKLTPDPKIADSLFLYYLFSGPEMSERIKSQAIGSSVPGFNLGQLSSLTLYLPSLLEQQKIVTILSSLDDKIELNRQMNQTLEEMARALFKSWFVDFDPVRAKAEGRTPAGMDAETAALFPDTFQESALGEIPGGWDIKSIDEIANFLNGLALQKFPPESDKFLPVIKIAELRRGVTDSSDKASPNINPRFIVNDGDILFSWSGSLAVCFWAGGKGALNQHLFKVTSDIFPKWFYYLWVKHYLPNYQQIAASKATTMGHIQRHHLSESLVIVPPIETLKQMTQFIQPLTDQILNNNLESRTLTTIRDELLPKLLSGQLRVDESEEFVGSIA